MGEEEKFKITLFHYYLKFTFGYEFPQTYGGGDKRNFDEVDEDVEPEIVMRIFVLDNKKNRYVELDSIPDIGHHMEIMIGLIWEHLILLQITVYAVIQECIHWN